MESRADIRKGSQLLPGALMLPGHSPGKPGSHRGQASDLWVNIWSQAPRGLGGGTEDSPRLHPHPPTQGVTRTRSSPGAGTHHIPLLYTVAALDEGVASGYPAACRGDVTLRPSQDGVGPWLTAFLPIPTILQGNSVRLAPAPPSLGSSPPPPAPSGQVTSGLFAHDEGQRTK